MKYSQLLLGFLFLLIAANSAACTCDGREPFMTVYKEADLVALVKIISHKSRILMETGVIEKNMEVGVIETYKGTESRKKVTIWGDNGNLCRPSIFECNDSGYYVVALFEGDPKSGNAGETASDYYISSCGEYWLTVSYEQRTVGGQITKRKKEMKLEKLKAKLTSG